MITDMRAGARDSLRERSFLAKADHSKAGVRTTPGPCHLGLDRALARRHTTPAAASCRPPLPRGVCGLGDLAAIGDSLILFPRSPHRLAMWTVTSFNVGG